MGTSVRKMLSRYRGTTPGVILGQRQRPGRRNRHQSQLQLRRHQNINLIIHENDGMSLRMMWLSIVILVRFAFTESCDAQ